VRVCKLTEYQIFLHISTIEPKVTKNSIKIVTNFRTTIKIGMPATLFSMQWLS